VPTHTLKHTMPSLTSLFAIAAACLATTSYAGDTTNTAFFSTPTAEPTNVRTMTYSGCFSDSRPMIDHGPYDFQSQGNCQRICYTLGNFVMGLGNGTDCWCGDELPSVSSKVDDSQCNTPCAGYGSQTCTTLCIFNLDLY
jgi:cell wall integrity and stress response component